MTHKLTLDFRVEIPQDLREHLGLKVGDKVDWILTGKSAKIVRVPNDDEKQF
ncbi:MAG: AbrB/MazE/SpoVT family DNA-binding domain-containing protein [Bryobacteraceae bacterium]